MAKLINAPHLADQPHEPYSDIFILAGRKAWQAWDKGKGEEWLLLCSLIYGLDRNIKPVILAENQLENISSIRIVKEDQQSVKLVQYGELAQAEITAICQNLAKNSNAIDVKLLDAAAQTKEDLSGYIQRLRNDKETADLAEQLAPPEKLKEKDGTNKKSRAFQKWLNLDMSLQRGCREIYAYDGKTWNKQENDDLEEKAVKFLDENEFNYSDSTIDRLINTLKAQLPRMGETSSDLIAFDNGVLNRNTLEFEPHNRQNWLTACIPHNYDEQATNTPHFDKWLNFVSDGNKEKARNILAVLYAILTNRYNWQIFFEITGKGGSGKSVFASIATLLAGDKNTASSKLENFDDERGLAGLENKMLIICAEQAKYGGDGGGLKAISGGDTVRVRYNYKDPFNTKITALVMLINNEPCRFTERSGGINRRRVIFDFKKSVPEDERDSHFMDKITLEVGGIIRKVLDTFSEPTDAKKALMAQMNSQEALEVKKLSDPLTDFFGYFYTTEQMNGLFIGVANMGLDRIRTHLYPAYLAYTRAMNISELGLRNFVTGIEQALKQHGNEYDFIKKSTKTGVRTNVHYKDFDNFRNEVSN
ncbi:DNA primase family protein [Pasteurella bettyae]|uniref:Nucleoside triphosphatase, D5 family n=1 Tax=Pasteurella bettyae CCUG 2042 TaxID=1095749 RepID=I3DCD2_9PAST|nr:phage/plasmid primase, P4 family [Pasteurella bettyae]EIJ69375.1 nucleoside triphosphatase, D5 family [Pasteurella bettyae CCUG 2042]SUB21426.1 Superfamily II helicase and inactivated derivatives [Pasteurella bettyae]